MLLELSDEEVIATMVLTEMTATKLREAVPTMLDDFDPEAALAEAERLEAFANRLRAILLGDPIH